MTGCGLAAMAWQLARFRVLIGTAPYWSTETRERLCKEEYRRIIDRLAKGEKA